MTTLNQPWRVLDCAVRGTVDGGACVTTRYEGVEHAHDIPPAAWAELFEAGAASDTSAEIERARALTRGRHLFDLVLSDDANWRRASTDGQERLCLRFLADDSCVDLPWEWLARGESFLALRPRLHVCRRALGGDDQPPPSWPAAALRVLFASAVAGGADIGVRRELDIALEAAATAGRERRTVFAIEPAPAVGLEQLDRLLSVAQRDAQPYHVIHLALHASQGGMLAFETAHGAFEMVPTEQLAERLAGADPHVVVITTCWGADARGLATALARHGVPEVVGFSGRTPDAHVLHFTRGFYRTFGSGTFADAVRAGRLALQSQADDEGRALADWTRVVHFQGPARTSLGELVEIGSSNSPPSDAQNEADTVHRPAGLPANSDTSSGTSAFITAVSTARVAEATASYVPLGVNPEDWDPDRHAIAVVQGPPNSGRQAAALALAAYAARALRFKPGVFSCIPPRDSEPAAVVSSVCKRHPRSLLIVRGADEWVEHSGWDDVLADVLANYECRLILTVQGTAPGDRAKLLRTHLPEASEVEKLFFAHGRRSGSDERQCKTAWDRVRTHVQAGIAPAAIANLWDKHRTMLIAASAPAAEPPAEQAAEAAVIRAALGNAQELCHWFDQLSPARQAQVVLVAALPGLERGRLCETVGAVLASAGFDDAHVGGVWAPDNKTLSLLRLRCCYETGSLEFEPPSIATFVRGRLPEYAFLLRHWMRALASLLTPARRPDVEWRRACGIAVGQLGARRPWELCDYMLSPDRPQSDDVAGYALAEACRSNAQIVADVTRRLKQSVDATKGEASADTVRTALHVFPALVTTTAAPFSLAESCAAEVERQLHTGARGAEGLKNDLRGRLRLLVRADPKQAARRVVKLLSQPQPPSFCGWLIDAVVAQLGASQALATWGAGLLGSLLTSRRRAGPLAQRTREVLLVAASVQNGLALKAFAWNDDPVIARALREHVQGLLAMSPGKLKEPLSPAQCTLLEAIACQADWALGGSAGPDALAGRNELSTRLARLLTALSALPAQQLVALWSREDGGMARRASRVHVRAAIFRRLRAATADRAHALRGECQALRVACDARGVGLWPELHALAQRADVPVTYVRPADSAVSTVLVIRESAGPAPLLAKDIAQRLVARSCDVITRELSPAPVRPLLCADLDVEQRAGFDLVIVVARTRFADQDDWRGMLGPALLLVSPDAAPDTLVTGPHALAAGGLAQVVAAAALRRLGVSPHPA